MEKIRDIKISSWRFYGDKFGHEEALHGDFYRHGDLM